MSINCRPPPLSAHLHSLHFHPEKRNNLRAQTTRKAAALLHHYNLPLFQFKMVKFQFSKSNLSPQSFHSIVGNMAADPAHDQYQLFSLAGGNRPAPGLSRGLTCTALKLFLIGSHAVDDAAFRKSAGHVWRHSAQQMMHSCLNFMCTLCWSQKCMEWWEKALWHADVAYEAGC